MECMEAQRKITDFINGKLDRNTTEEFLQHIEKCRECKEELEIYYIFFIGIKQLDEDKMGVLNLHMDFEQHLAIVNEKMRRQRLFLLEKKVTFIIILILVVLWVSVGAIDYLSVEEDTRKYIYVKEHVINERYWKK